MNSDIRKISADGFHKPEAIDAGPAPVLNWLEIADLRVDEAYQRRISKTGRISVMKIATKFDWSQFSPVLVAPIEGGVYAIIDGQHRTTAALICGFDMVPCQVVQADRRKQAAAFAAVNGNVQRISSMQVFHAAREAGEEWAVRIANVAERAGVTILRYPMAANLPERPRHSTMAVSVIGRIIERQGEDIALQALACITKTELGEDPAVLGAIWIPAIAWAISERKHIASDDLVAFFNDLDAGEARQESARLIRKGTSGSQALGLVLGQKLDAIHPDVGVAA